MTMTFDELANKTEKFLERVQQEELKYSRIEDCIEKLRSEFGGELRTGILFLEDAMVDSRCQSIDGLVRDFVKELEESI